MGDGKQLGRAVRKGYWLKLGKRRIFKSFDDDVSIETEVEGLGKRG